MSAPNLIVSNLSDGSSATIASGATTTVNLQMSPAAPAGSSGSALQTRGIFISWDTSEWTFSLTSLDGGPLNSTSRGDETELAAETQINLTAGVTLASDFGATGVYQPVQQGDVPDGTAGEYLHLTPAALLQVPLVAPGQFFLGVVLQGFTATAFCGITLNVLPAPGAAGPTAPTTSAVDESVDLVWDLVTNAVTTPTPLPPSTGTTPLIYVKEGDDIVVRLGLVKNGVTVAPAITAATLTLKQFEPEASIEVSDGFATTGSGLTFATLIHTLFTAAALAAALTDYEADAGTSFLALAELQIVFTNPFDGIGGETLTRTSRTFSIQIDRDLTND